MDKSRKRIAQDYARNAIVDGDTNAGRYEKKMAVKEAAGEGPSMKSEIYMAGTSMGSYNKPMMKGSGLKMCGSQVGKHMKMGGPKMMGSDEKIKVKTNTVGDTRYTKTTTKAEGYKKKNMEMKHLDGMSKGGVSSTQRYNMNNGYDYEGENKMQISSTPTSAYITKAENPKQFRNINKLVRKGLRSKK